MPPLRLGTRNSPLARWQAEHVRARLRALAPDRACELVPIVTRGDREQDRPLAAPGAPGLFTAELDRAMERGEIQAAVHSAKDLPTELPPFVVLAAALERHDPRDVLVSPTATTLAALPEGALVLTSSPRRRAQLLALRPDLRWADVRGNVETRLRRLREQGAAAIVLAKAGLDRLGLDVPGVVLAPDRMTPAVGQGILACTARADDADTRALLARLEHSLSRRALDYERAFLRTLHGGCQAPIGCYAQPARALFTRRRPDAEGRQMRPVVGNRQEEPSLAVPGSRVQGLLRGSATPRENPPPDRPVNMDPAGAGWEVFAFVGAPDGRAVLRRRRTSAEPITPADAEALADELLAAGAAALIARARATPAPEAP